jgi:hypothetical protein
MQTPFISVNFVTLGKAGAGAFDMGRVLKPLVHIADSTLVTGIIQRNLKKCDVTTFTYPIFNLYRL